MLVCEAIGLSEFVTPSVADFANLLSVYAQSSFYDTDGQVECTCQFGHPFSIVAPDGEFVFFGDEADEIFVFCEREFSVSGLSDLRFFGHCVLPFEVANSLRSVLGDAQCFSDFDGRILSVFEFFIYIHFLSILQVVCLFSEVGFSHFFDDGLDVVWLDAVLVLSFLLLPLADGDFDLNFDVLDGRVCVAVLVVVCGGDDLVSAVD